MARDSYDPRLRLEHFVFTMDIYKRIVRNYPIKMDENRMTGDAPKEATCFIEDEKAYGGIYVRAMLQRKYFNDSNPGGENPFHIRNLINDARSLFPSAANRMNDMERILASCRDISATVMLSTGKIVANSYNTLSDILYGALLHADPERIERLLRAPEALWINAIAEYVIDRDHLLLEFDKLLRDLGIRKIDFNDAKRAPAVFKGKSYKGKRTIRKSPYWSNLVGRDIDDNEYQKLANRTDAQTAYLILYCYSFIELLRANTLNVKALRRLTVFSTWSAWGDFTEASSIVKSAKDLGVSERVIYSADKRTAIVRMFEGVEAPFFITEPHVIRCSKLTFKRTFGKWKIHSLQGFK